MCVLCSTLMCLCCLPLPFLIHVGRQPNRVWAPGSATTTPAESCWGAFSKYMRTLKAQATIVSQVTQCVVVTPGVRLSAVRSTVLIRV